ncbi:3-hydroxyanthranilic acid dioxygenase [Coelomomyces lativittatus]|nr:3-hydroxyanthranilic acid dioxygenase [Coelomomyces lativittatus]
MLLKVVDEKNRFLDIHIHEGDMLLLPASIPHSPNRFKDTIGLVIERPRPSGKKDALRWYCESCKAILFEDSFECTDLNVQLAPVIQAFYASKDLRTCKKCGLLNPGKDF